MLMRHMPVDIVPFAILLRKAIQSDFGQRVVFRMAGELRKNRRDDSHQLGWCEPLSVREREYQGV